MILLEIGLVTENPAIFQLPALNLEWTCYWLLFRSLVQVVSLALAHI